MEAGCILMVKVFLFKNQRCWKWIGPIGFNRECVLIWVPLEIMLTWVVIRMMIPGFRTLYDLSFTEPHKEYFRDTAYQVFPTSHR